MAAVDPITPYILGEVHSRLADFLDIAIRVARKEEDTEDIDTALAAVPLTTPPQCITDLLELCQLEGALDQDLGRTKDLLATLSSEQLPAAYAVHQQHDQAVLAVDRWAADVQGALQHWWQPWMALEEMPDASGSAVSGSEDIGNGSDGNSDGSSDGLAEDGDNDRGGRGRGRFSQDSQQGVLYALLASRVRIEVAEPKVFQDWRAPTTGALLGQPPSRFGTVPWAMPSPQQPVPGPVRRDTTTDNARSYLERIIEQRTPAERVAYEATCKRMCSCTARPAGAEVHKMVSLWSPLIRDDNWWHCRRLTQMLAVECPTIACDAFEQQLMLLLAAFEAGSTEGVLWIPALAGLTRQLSREVQGAGERAEELVQELATFAYAVALNNLSLRFYARRLDTNKVRAIMPWDVQVWYSTLYHIGVACDSSMCIEPLPHPRELTTRVTSKLFSNGSRYVRLGCRAVRSPISQNRPEAFPCLITWLRTYEPHPALVAAFLWFGTVYHVMPFCKAGRGKWADNF
jgi:hypothetical protein